MTVSHKLRKLTRNNMNDKNNSTGLNVEYELNLKNEKVVRWDQYRINQFSFTNNLLITLNLGFLGFLTSQSSFEFNSNCCLLAIQFLAIIVLMISFLTGMLTALNRLKDFRLTSRLTKLKKKKFEHEHSVRTYSNIEEIKSDIQALKAITKELGPKTWILLNWQIWSFFIGSILGIALLIIVKMSVANC